MSEPFAKTHARAFGLGMAPSWAWHPADSDWTVVDSGGCVLLGPAGLTSALGPLN